MPSLIDLRRRIRSVKNTQQITKAMKTVSTAKFRKAQRTVVDARPFWHDAPGAPEPAAPTGPGGRRPPAARRPARRRRVERHRLTSDKGLCGGFNSNIIAGPLAFIQAKAAAAQVRLVLVGKKAVDFFRKRDSWSVDRSIGDKTDKLTRRRGPRLGRVPDRGSTPSRRRTPSTSSTTSSSPSPAADRGHESSCRIAPNPGTEPGGDVDCRTGSRARTAARVILPRYVESQVRHASSSRRRPSRRRG